MNNLTTVWMRFVTCVAPAMVLALAAGCAQPLRVAGSLYTITIAFDAKGCAKSVDEADLPVNKGDRVEWVAAGGEKFEIWFDPFVDGKPLDGTNGPVTSTPIDTKAPGGTPPVVYKYTVLTMIGDRKPVPHPDCDPLDPRLRVS